MVSAQPIRRPLQRLSEEAAERLRAQLGVFEIVSDAGGTELIAHAGALEPFGLRSALGDAAARYHDVSFRYEYTHAYMTRWQELLMLHVAEHGSLPAGNHQDAHRIGRLR